MWKKSWLPLLVVAAALTAVVSVSRTSAEPKENQTPAGATMGTDFVLGPERATTMPPMTYFCTTFKTTFAEMDRVHGEIEELFKTLEENKIQPAGYVMFIYKGVGQDMTKPFQLSIGMVVPPGTKAAGKYEVKDLPEFKCSSALYNGGLASIGSAYMKHYGEIVGAGQTPTDESRELYLYWEGPESNNNVVWLQAGLQ